MYLKASANPKFDPAVQTIQMKLNAINIQVHGNWPYLQTDGLFGEKTKQAVKAFQAYRNITSTSGEVDDKTLDYINESYNHVPQLKNLDPNLKTYRTVNSNPDWKSIAGKFVSQLAGTLNDISKDIEGQIKYFKSQKVSPQDVERLMRRLFCRPDVSAMRKSIEESVFKELEKTARGNTNVWNTAHGSHSVNNARQIGEAQRQVAKGVLNSQNKKVVEKKLAEQLLNKVITELEGVNFKNKITNSLKGKGVPKITGGGVLTAVMLLPIGWHFCVWIDACINQKPNASAAFNTFVSDIISLIEGALIGLAVGTVVAAIGLVGWVAVVVALVIAIIIGIVLEVFFPNHSKWLAEKIISATKSLLNSSVFQEATRTSFV